MNAPALTIHASPLVALRIGLGFRLSPRAVTAYSPFAFALGDFRLSPARRSPSEQFAGAGPGLLPGIGPAHHPRDLVDPLPRPSRVTEVTVRGPATRLLDVEVGRAGGGNLRQVRDAEDLEALAERAQLLAHHRRDPPADAGVDLVEDERLARLVGRGQRLQRQHHARQLAAGHDARQRPESSPGLGDR